MVDEDYVEKVISTSSHDTLLFFSNLGKVYKLRAFQIPYAGRLAKGLPVVNLLNFSETEKLAAILNIDESKDVPTQLSLFDLIEYPLDEK